MAAKTKFTLLAAVLLASAGAISLLIWQSRAGDEKGLRSLAHNRVKIYSNDTDILSDTPPPSKYPTDVIVWKVRIHEVSDDINIEYDKVARHTLQAGVGVSKYLEDIARGNSPKSNEWVGFNTATDINNPERETPLSIRHTGYSYMVFVLDKKNWNFTAGREPFEVRRDKKQYYSDPLCAWLENGNIQVKRATSLTARCTVASFIADSRLDQKETGDDTKAFHSPFNLYVTLHVKGNQGRVRGLPLVIDPDVGYPGGNYP